MTTRVTSGMTTGVVKDTDKASKVSTSSSAADEGKVVQLNASGEIPTGYYSAGGTNTPYFRAVLTSNQNVTDNTDTQIAFDSEILDSGSGFTTGASANYTVPADSAGVYYISLQVQGDGGGAGTLIQVNSSIKVGGTVKAESQNSLATNNGDIICSRTDAILDLSVGDEVTFFGLVDTSGSGQRFAGSSNNNTSVFGFKLI